MYQSQNNKFMYNAGIPLFSRTKAIIKPFIISYFLDRISGRLFPAFWSPCYWIQARPSYSSEYQMKAEPHCIWSAQWFSFLLQLYLF